MAAAPPASGKSALHGRRRRNAVLIAVLVLAVLAWDSVYVVGQAAQGVVLRFGAPIAVVNPVGHPDPGLKFKLPLVDRVVLFDRRNQPLEAEQAEVAAQGRDRLSLDAGMRFRIVDPLRFYRTLGDEDAAQGRLQELLTSSLANVLGTASVQDIVGAGRDGLMQRARTVIAGAAKSSGLGIKVLDVQLLRIMPSPAGLQAIYRRMAAARQQEGADARAAGDEHKREITAEADKAAAAIRGAANGQAEQIRGAGEAKRAAIFTDAYGRDPDFAGFLREMQAYRETLGQGDTTIVMTPASAFLRGLDAGPDAPLRDPPAQSTKSSAR